MFRIPNWREHQGYQKRGPKWVKLHVRLLRNKFWPKMSVLARATLPALWIVAAEQSQDGSLDDDTESLAHLIAMPENDLVSAIIELKSFGFIESDKTVACLAEESSQQTERERETEERRGETHRAHARVPGTSTALCVEDAEKIDRLDEDIAFEERRFTALALPIRDTIQTVLDSLPRPATRAPFSAARWTRTGLTGIGRSENALTVLRLTNDALEARQRAQDAPILSENNRKSFEAADRVLARLKADQAKEPMKEIR